MFCSFVQTQLFVLVVCSIVFARRPDMGDGVTIPAQQPMLHVRPATPKDDVPESPKGMGSDATIKLFPPSPHPLRRPSSSACKETDFNTIALKTDVCLSGDYYLNHNMLISKAPVCPDGSTPTMIYYPARGCIGKAQFESDKNPNPEYCLWGGIVPKYWSLIFRCGSDARTGQGADGHKDAIPPVAPKADVDSETPYDGIVDLLLRCRNHQSNPNAVTRRFIVSVDTCIVTSEGVRINREAICPNGKRAQWARFEDANCNEGQLSDKYGLVDIYDKDINVEYCLSGAPYSEERIRSVAFWCDGEGLGSSTSNLPIPKPVLIDVGKFPSHHSASLPKIEAESFPPDVHLDRPKMAEPITPPCTRVMVEADVGFYLLASLVFLIGIRICFGPLISRVFHTLRRWPFKSSTKGEIFLGDDKV